MIESAASTATMGNDVIVFPSEWVKRWAGHLPRKAKVLDLACGAGRHARLLARLGHEVDAADIDVARIESAKVAGVNAIQIDLEQQPWAFAPGAYGGIVVTNYLHRPLFPRLVEALAPGGVLIYETFSAGNERFGKPSNPDFLLQPGELLDVFYGQHGLLVRGYEDIYVSKPRPGCVQHICAVKPGAV